MSGHYCLYPKSSFLEGMARLFDFGGSLNQYNFSKTGREADRRAIQSDWQAVGNDIRDAIQSFEKDHGLDLDG